MKRIILPVLVTLTLLLVACGGEETPEERAVTVTARDIEYSTNQIEVTAGQPLALTLQNEGALTHDFSIADIPLSGEVVGAEEMDDHEMSMDAEELAIHVAAAPGESETITFTPSQAGEYEYFCTVEGHRDAGMHGTLVVTAP